jgi:microcompartment protein CcmL/EutN
VEKGQTYRPVIQDIRDDFIVNEPSLGLLELNSIARGLKVCDAILKQAPVDLLEAAPICTGKYLIIIGGEVDAVRASFDLGTELAENCLIDSLYLAKLDKKVFPAVLGTQQKKEIDSLGIIETVTVASSIIAADTAVKTAEIDLLEIRLAQGLGGKGFVTFSGELNDVMASLEAGTNSIREKGLLLRDELIPSPDPVLVNKLLGR